MGQRVLQEGDKALCSWGQPNASAGHSGVVPATAAGMGRKCATTHSRAAFCLLRCSVQIGPAVPVMVLLVAPLEKHMGTKAKATFLKESLSTVSDGAVLQTLPSTIIVLFAAQDKVC